MTEIQKRLMQLMGEIDDICTKEHLHYVLTHQTARYVYDNKKFINSAYEFQLLMPLPDIFTLQNVINTGSNASREFESWEDNASLRQMVFRYVDTSSLLIDDENPEYHTKPGIAVTIYAVKTKKPSRDVLGGERYLQMYNEGRKKSFWIPITTAKIAEKCFGKEWAQTHFHIEDLDILTENTKGLKRGAVKAMKVGTAKLAQYVLESQEDCPSYGEAKKLWYMRQDGSLINIPKKFFEKTKRIPMEQWEFPVPTNTKEYFALLFEEEQEDNGDNNAANAYYPISSRIRVISDPKMPYEEYLNFINSKGLSYKSNARYRAEFDYWLRTVHEKTQEESYQIYVKAKSAVERMDVWQRLKPKREDIRTAYNASDVDKLSTLLKEYMGKTEKYRKKGVGFYIDEELFESAKLVWKKKKPAGYAEEVYALVPDEYINESLEDYFSQR